MSTTLVVSTSSGAAIGRVRVGSWASQAGMSARVDEQVFEEQRDESGQQLVRDIDVRRHSATAIPHAPVSFGEEVLFGLKAGLAGGRLRRPSSAGNDTTATAKCRPRVTFSREAASR